MRIWIWAAFFLSSLFVYMGQNEVMLKIATTYFKVHRHKPHDKQNSLFFMHDTSSYPTLIVDGFKAMIIWRFSHSYFTHWAWIGFYFVLFCFFDYLFATIFLGRGCRWMQDNLKHEKCLLSMSNEINAEVMRNYR